MEAAYKGRYSLYIFRYVLLNTAKCRNYL